MCKRMRRRRFPILLGLLAGLGMVGASTESRGQYMDCGQALNETLRTGRPTVVLVTSRTAPASLQLRDELLQQLDQQPVAAIQFTEMPIERYPDRVQRLGINTYPTLLIYGSDGSALTLLGHRSGAVPAYEVLNWLHTLGLIADPVPAHDSAVAQTGLFHKQQHQQHQPHPTPQQPALPPHAAPPQAAPAPPQQAAPPQAAPMQAAPAMSPVIMQQAAPPVVVQQPSQSVYIQQQAPKIMLGMAPPPEITVVQGPQQAPTVSFGVVGAAAPAPAPAPAQNLFLAPAPPAPQPAPGLPSPQFQQPAAPTAAPQAPAQVPTFAMPAQPAAPTFAMGEPVPHQQSLVASTAIALLLDNPGLIDRLIDRTGQFLRWTGDHFSKRGAPRLRLVEQRAAPAPAAAYALPSIAVGAVQPSMFALPTAQPTVSAPSAAYTLSPLAAGVVQPSMFALPTAQPAMFAAPTAPMVAPAAPQYYAVPSAPAPSPQATHPSHDGKHGLLPWFKGQ